MTSKTKKETLEKIKKAKEKKLGAELLKLTESYEEVDEDVADMCLGIYPEDDLFSFAELMIGVQDIKDKLRENIFKEIEEKLKEDKGAGAIVYMKKEDLEKIKEKNDF